MISCPASSKALNVNRWVSPVSRTAAGGMITTPANLAAGTDVAVGTGVGLGATVGEGAMVGAGS